MQGTRLAAIALAGVAALGVVAADAPAEEQQCRQIRGADTNTDTTDDVSVCRLDTWFHESATRVTNADGSSATFDGNAPEATGGGGTFITQGLGAGEQRAVFEGTFDGPIDNAAITLYSYAPARRAFDRLGLGDLTVDLVFAVDGVPIYETSSADGDAITTTHLDNGLSESKFMLENLFAGFEDLSEFLTPEGTHTVTLTVRAHYTDGDNAVLVYGNPEVPAGMVFNIEPTEPKGFTRLRY